MSANYVTFARGIYFEDFLLEQEQNRILFVYTDDAEYASFLDQQVISELEFAFNSHLEFLANVTQYFRGEHVISDELLQQRRAEVRLIRFFFDLNSIELTKICEVLKCFELIFN